MRLKRLMSIVLAAVMMMSLAISASAQTTLYLKQDFDYADYAELCADIPVNVETIDTVVPSLRAAGEITALARSYYVHTSHIADVTRLRAHLGTNAKGNKEIRFYTEAHDNSGESEIIYAMPSTWNGKTNSNESFVVSFDMSNNVYKPAGSEFWHATHTLLSIIGQNDVEGVATYRQGVLMDLGASNGTGGGLGSISSHSPNGYYSGGKYFEFTSSGEVVHVAMKFKYNPSEDRLESITAFNGTTVDQKVGTYDMAGLYTIDGLYYLGSYGRPPMSVVKMYSVTDADGFKATASVNGTKVPTTLDKVTINFTQPVYTFSTDAITVTANGEELSGVSFGDLKTTATVGGAYTSSIDVNLPALAMSTDYVITVDSSVMNELGEALEASTISFSTPKPDITTSVSFTNLVKGSVGEANVIVTNNTESTSKNIAVIYAIYAADGKLVDVVYANDTVAADSKVTITAGIKLSDSAAKAKAMVWDGISTINPYTGFDRADVAAQ